MVNPVTLITMTLVIIRNGVIGMMRQKDINIIPIICVRTEDLVISRMRLDQTWIR